MENDSCGRSESFSLRVVPGARDAGKGQICDGGAEGHTHVLAFVLRRRLSRLSRYPKPRWTYGTGLKWMGKWDVKGRNVAKCTSVEEGKNSSRAISERVVENSSQDVSPFAVIEARFGIVEVESAEVVSMIIVDGVGNEPTGKWRLKGEEASSSVVTEEDDGDGGGTTIW